MDVEFIVYALVIMGAILLAAYMEHEQNNKLRKTGGRVRGVIVRNNFHIGRTSVFRPVVRFTTPEGVVIECEYQKGVALAVPQFSDGTAIWVAYDKKNPSDFLIID